ncbi:MAG: efflux RND transporter permease subunit [Capsulimonas sp.]|uniref:efflux RND transporter permease subunit n=1 Tax=Capsulimonas sp. TaxID=2494211 RepID=UPI003262D462
MSIARVSVTRPVAVTMRIAALVLLGAVCLSKLPVDLLPNVSIPTVAVVTQWPNVSPEEIETELTRPIEEAVSATPGVATVTSSSTLGSSTVRIQFGWGTDVGQAAIDVLQVVERARQRLPNDPTIQSPTVFKFDPSQQPILVYGVSGIDDPVKLRTLLENEVSPLVEAANGVASAVTTGGNTRSILVNADPDRLRAYGLGIDDISKRIMQENLNLPAGIAKQSNTELTIRSLGWFDNPSQIAQVPIKSTNGRIVTVGDVATVTDSQQEQRLFTRLNGALGAGIIISKQSGSNTIETAKSVEEKVAEAEKRYPQLKFSKVYDQSQFIDVAITDLKINAVLGGALAIIILLFFLRSIRSTLVVAISIPISIFSTFTLLYMCGFTLNTMSLGGLALATGLIADDAVVVLENIYRHFERDKVRPADAAIAGTNEIMSAVFASTITVIVVFLPLLLIKGQTGQMFTQFALVVIFSISISLLDAVTVVPMLASRLMNDSDHDPAKRSHSPLQKMFDKFGGWFDALDNSYRRGLTWTLRHRPIVIVGVIGVTALSFLLVPHIGTEIMPQTDSGDMQINVKLQPGTALATTDKVIQNIAAAAKKNENVEQVFAASGSGLSLRGTSAAMNGNQGALMVRLKEDRKQKTADVVDDMRKQFMGFPGARVSVSQVDVVSRILTGGNSNVEVDVFGSSIPQLSSIGQDIVAKLRSVPGMSGVDVNWQESSPEMQWKIDRDKAIQQGVTFEDIATTLGAATNGSISSYYQEDGFQYPIVVQVPEEKRRTEQQLNTLPITPTLAGATPHTIMLQQVAHPEYNQGPGEITRQDRQRYIAITGTPQGRSTGDLQKDISAALKGYQMPQGYYWDWGYRQKQQAQEFGGMGIAVALAIALIYMLLAAQFESFVHPLTILCSVPVAAVGVLLALFLTGRSFGLTALIGVLMLVGIVVKNGILLVEYTNVLRSRGYKRDEAVLEAGPTRLRPILMTTSATVLGMMPIALELGKGSETNGPMATAVIGGLLTSTILTLFVVPTVYTLFDDLGRRFRKNDKDLSAPVLVGPTPAAVGDGSLAAEPSERLEV